MSKSYANRVELRDGAVMLYQKPAAKRPIWYYRIHVRGMHNIDGAKIKYDERSTGETDLDEAKRIGRRRLQKMLQSLFLHKNLFVPLLDHALNALRNLKPNASPGDIAVQVGS